MLETTRNLRFMGPRFCMHASHLAGGRSTWLLIRNLHFVRVVVSAEVQTEASGMFPLFKSQLEGQSSVPGERAPGSESRALKLELLETLCVSMDQLCVFLGS